MRLTRFINEVKMMDKTMIGFKIDPHSFTSIIKKISNILKNSNIHYEVIKDHHITIAQIVGKNPKDDIIREINTIKGLKFKPKGISKIYGPIVKKDFIAIEYRINDKYINIFKEIAHKFDVRLFIGGPIPHISIIKAEPNLISDSLFDVILSEIKSKLPLAIPDSVVLFNKKFQIEFEKDL